MPRPDVSAERKHQILQAAERVFAREGLTNTRMEQIAAEAGLSVGILYQYFKDRDDLVYQLLLALTEQDLATYPDLLQAPGSARRKLERIFTIELDRTLAIAPLFYALYARVGHAGDARLLADLLRPVPRYVHGFGGAGCRAGRILPAGRRGCGIYFVGLVLGFGGDGDIARDAGCGDALRRRRPIVAGWLAAFVAYSFG